MAAYRCFIFPEALIAGDRVTLDLRESHHLVRVLRARTGAAVELLDGKGGRFRGELQRADAKRAEVRVRETEALRREGPELSLVQALPKGKAMDLILRMATEIGVRRIQPVFAEHGEVRIRGERLAGKVEKWRATMVESCKQCGLPFLPELEAPLPLRELGGADWFSRSGPGFVASLEAGSRPLAEEIAALKPAAGGPAAVSVAVGPEGDFSEGEYAWLREAGFRPVRLGANVLRAETAAAYILSVVDQLARASS